MTTVAELRKVFIDTYNEYYKNLNEYTSAEAAEFSDAEYFADDLESTGAENVEELRRTLDFALKEREHFDMHYWFMSDDRHGVVAQGDELSCGTTLCLAGTAAFLNLNLNEALKFSYVFEYNPTTKEIGELVQDVESRGGDVLGLNFEQADTLFTLPNDIKVVEAAMNLVAGEVLLPR